MGGAAFWFMFFPVCLLTLGAAVAPGPTRPTQILRGHGPAREAALEPEYSEAALHRRRPASPTVGATGFVQPPAHAEYTRLSLGLSVGRVGIRGARVRQGPLSCPFLSLVSF
jgi:hypothetical protein